MNETYTITFTKEEKRALIYNTGTEHAITARNKLEEAEKDE